MRDSGDTWRVQLIVRAGKCQGLLSLPTIMRGIRDDVCLELRFLFLRFVKDSWLDVAYAADGVRFNADVLTTLRSEVNRTPLYLPVAVPVPAAVSSPVGVRRGESPRADTKLPPLSDTKLAPLSDVKIPPLPKPDMQSEPKLAAGHARAVQPVQLEESLLDRTMSWRADNVVPLKYVLGQVIPSIVYFVTVHRDIDLGDQSKREFVDSYYGLAEDSIRVLHEWLLSLRGPPLYLNTNALLTDSELLVMSALIEVISESASFLSLHVAARMLRDLLFVAPSQNMFSVNFLRDERTIATRSMREMRLLRGDGPEFEREGVRARAVSSPQSGVVLCFNNFVQILKSDNGVAGVINNEFIGFVDSVVDATIVVAGSYTPLTCETVLRQWLNYAMTVRDDRSGLRNVLRLVRAVVDAAQDSERSSARQEAQIELDKLNATRVVFEQIGAWRADTDEDDGIFHEVLLTGIALLEGGNQHVQRTFFALMRDHPEDFINMIGRRIAKGAAELATHKLRAQQLVSQRGRAVTKVKGRLFTESGAIATGPGGVLLKRGAGPTGGRHKKVHASTGREFGGTSAGLSTVREAAAVTEPKDDVQLSNAKSEKSAIGLIISLFRFLQVLCEGHAIDIQNFLREQPESRRPLNLVAACAQFLEKLICVVDANSVDLLLQVCVVLVFVCTR